MGSAEVEIRIDHPVDDVWAVVGDFAGLASWSPGIESCEVDGEERTIVAMGMEIVERLVRRDDDNHVIAYGIVGGVPVDRHEATITVHPDGDGSRVTYHVEVEPDTMLPVMEQTYGGALKALARHLG